MDPSTIRRARKILRVDTDAEAIRVSVARIAEMDAFWRFMRRTYRSAAPGSFRA